MKRIARSLLVLAPTLGMGAPTSVPWLPLNCHAEKTVGLHDYFETEKKQIETYEPSIFFASRFTLHENRTFSTFLEQENVALFVTMTDEQSGNVSEFQCDTVRGTGDTFGYSCRNSPPSDILMLNPESLRFTRGAVGGWTFYSTGEDHNGTSLFVEYGQCQHAEDEPIENGEL
ncbi:uncharacterized protein METZ01_LOCUS34038 [marine metagenome]|uniref:Uncharacterized protein n=1 Tax=marine metagenome TaxID=408172 RepID=A0A381QQF2_9ZZZZ|nr:hypothetical protein [Gammaproteobacteria bacterium]HCP50616.1 hypothetical protein [Gammaproteobacteria bacterium]|tara:strand:+ start:817 stop:1335 length:519 start_codon:yes stop_codon:yes gene_type:complete